MSSNRERNENKEIDHRSACPIAGGLDLFGDRWSLLLMRDLIYLEKRRYGQFLQSPEGIPTNILAERLKRFEREGIVEKRLYLEHPPRYEYHLTEKGKSLKPVLKAIIEWGVDNLPHAVNPF